MIIGDYIMALTHSDLAMMVTAGACSIRFCGAQQARCNDCMLNEGGAGRDRQRETGRNENIDRIQKDRQTESGSNRNTDRHTDRQTETAYRQAGR